MKAKAQTAIGVSDQIKYALFLLLASGVGGVVGRMCNQWITFFWQTYFSSSPVFAVALIAYPIIHGISLLIPFGALFWLFKRTVADQYLPSDDSRLWLRSALKMILPGELIRFLLCLSVCGLIRTTGLLALFPSDLFDLIYLPLSSRREAVRLEGAFAPQDFLAYTIIYLLYFALYLAVILLIYRRFWKVGKEEREDLVIRY